MNKLKKIFLEPLSPQVSFLIITFIVYLVCVLSQFSYFTQDTWLHQDAWWGYIREHGFSAVNTLNQDPEVHSDYTTIWYFVIWMFNGINLVPGHCIKILATICSVGCAIVVSRIVRHYLPDSKNAPTAALAFTLFSPAIFLDLVKTNLPDSLYILFVLIAYLCFIKRKQTSAWFYLSIGACFKLMAVYLAPLFLYSYIRDFKTNTLKEKLSPVGGGIGVGLCSLPCVFAGGRFVDGIIMPIINRAGGFSFSYTLWQFMPDDPNHFELLSIAATFFIVYCILKFIFAFVPKENRENVEITILPVLFPLICYYLLPAQHESYFSTAGVFAFIAWCARPSKKTFFVALVINFMIFISFTTIGFRHWLNPDFYSSVFYDIQLMSTVILSIIGYLIYLLYKNSSFNKTKNK